MTKSFKFEHNGSTYELTANPAPKDTNGNARIDIITLKDGETFRPTLKGFRKIKIGYRVQTGSHHYSTEIALADLKAALIAIDPIPVMEEVKPKVSSTHRTVTSKIRAYIQESLSDDETTELAEQLDGVIVAFFNWYGSYERRRTPNVQAAFKEWLQGMPSDLDITPYYEDMRELMDKWLGKSDKKYSDDVVAHKFHALIFREFQKLCSLNNVEGIYTRL